jgi:hypothetical protein
MQLGEVPEVIQLKVVASPYGKQFLGEVYNPNTRLIVAGGVLDEIIYWLEFHGYTYRHRSQGIWSKGVCGMRN